MINTVQAEFGLPQSVTIFGNTDSTTIQMLSFLQASNEELRDSNDDGWQALQTEFNLIVNVPVTTTGNTTLNSAVITNIPSTASLSANYWAVSGINISQGARIKSVDSATQVTLTMQATSISTGTALVFAQDTYAMPTDFRFYQNRTWWDRTNRWELIGPDSPQMDQWHRSGIVATGPRRHFRGIGPYVNNFRLWPPPAEITTPIQIVYEYISDNTVFVNGSATSFANVFANDADISIIDDRALMMGIKWRFWEQKGLNWASKRDEYDTYVARLAARDGGSQTLSLAKSQSPIFLSPSNTQDGFYPGPTGPNTS